jgi:hypothetical protein
MRRTISVAGPKSQSADLNNRDEKFVKCFFFVTIIHHFEIRN